MITQIVDEYSVSHFIVGVLAYHVKISISMLLLLQTLFEVLQLSNDAHEFLGNYINRWKPTRPDEITDEMLNSIGDIIFTLLGWLFACYIDHYDAD